MKIFINQNIFINVRLFFFFKCVCIYVIDKHKYIANGEEEIANCKEIKFHKCGSFFCKKKSKIKCRKNLPHTHKLMLTLQ